MGIFSKKTMICERCGKEYQARVTFLGNVCDECKKRQKMKEEAVSGYVRYALDMGLGPYTEEQLDDIAARRQRILEKCRIEQPMSRAELQRVSDNYKKLTDDEAERVLEKISIQSVQSTLGAVRAGSCYIPTGYEGMVVDIEDIFAVGYTSDYKLTDTKTEAILCAVFTNDPYVPAFPMMFRGKLGMFEIVKSKKARAQADILFTSICPNLTYAVQDLKGLKKEIKSEGTVKGNIAYEYMMDQVRAASVNSGIFNIEHMEDEMHYSTAQMIEEYGYMEELVIAKIMKLDSMFNGKYWEKQRKRIDMKNNNL